MPWYPINVPSEPPARPSLIGARAGGRSIVVTALDGTWYAVEDRCSHAGCAFSEDAVIEGDRLVCDCHGSEFEIRTGLVAGPPASEPIATFAVRVAGDHLEVEL